MSGRPALLAPLLALLCLLGAAPAGAAPAAPDRAAGTAAASGTGRFDGIAALDNCSAAVVRWPSTRPRDHALVLTNGHCHAFLGGRQVLADLPHRRDVTLLRGDGSDRVTLSTRRLVYATMYRTDVALYRLAQTYRQLRQRYGVSGLTVAPREPRNGSRLVVVSGFWKHTYRCGLNGFVHRLHEGDWDWWRSLRYSDGGCRIIDGTSGSPVVHPGGRRVLGVNNTYNENGRRCTIENPCEENRAGRISVHPGRAYGQQTWWLTTCVRRDRAFDLDRPGCRLPG